MTTLDGVLSLAVPSGPMPAPALDALCAAIGQADLDSSVHAVVLRGAGGRFGGPIEDDAAAGALVSLLLALRSLPKPVLALVDGEAVAEGVVLAAVADLTAASATSRFVIVEGQGGPPVGTALLVRHLGEGRALELVLTGRALDARQAQAAGLVAVVAPPGALDAALGAALTAVLGRGASAIARAKRSVLGESSDVREALERDRRVWTLASSTSASNAPSP